MSKIQKLKAALSKEFRMKDLREAKKILGMEILRDRPRGQILINQTAYFSKVVKKFHMESAKVVKTPFASHFKLSASQSPSDQLEISEMIPMLILLEVSCTVWCAAGQT